MEQNPYACAAADCILAVPGAPRQFGVAKGAKCRCMPRPGEVAGEHSRLKDGIQWLATSLAKKESRPGQAPGWRGSQQGDNLPEGKRKTSSRTAGGIMKLTEAKLRQIIREELGLHTITISDPEKIAREMEYFNPDPYGFDPDFGVLGVQGLYDALGALADTVAPGLMMSGGIESPQGSGEYTPLLIQGELKDLVAFGKAVRRELGGRQGLPRALDAQITALESSL